MKDIKRLCSLVLLAGLCISGTALADRGFGHGGYGHGYGGGYGHGYGRGYDHDGIGLGFYFGAPYPYYSYPYPYYSPYPYYPPAVVTVPAQPQVYIEQASPEPQQAPQASSYWYHCSNPEGYYPYIKACPEGWQKVVPTPPPQK